ncbi:unnamed protein product [Brassica oleracea]
MHCLVLKYWGLRDGSLRSGGDLFSLGRITTKYLRVPR